MASAAPTNLLYAGYFLSSWIYEAFIRPHAIKTGASRLIYPMREPIFSNSSFFTTRGVVPICQKARDRTLSSLDLSHFFFLALKSLPVSSAYTKLIDYLNSGLTVI